MAIRTSVTHVNAKQAHIRVPIVKTVVRCGFVGRDGAMAETEILSIIDNRIHSVPVEDGITVVDSRVSLDIEALPTLF